MVYSEKTSNHRILKLNDSLGELFTPEDISQYFKVSPTTVYNWVKTNKIDYHVLCRGKRKTTVRFDLEQIQRFIQSRSGD